MAPPTSPRATKIVVVREGVETELEVERWFAKDSVLSFRVPFGSQRRLADALGGELLYDSVSFTLRCGDVEYPACRVETWFRNGTLVIRASSPL